MYTLKDYLYFRGDLSFDAAPVNEIDELVFAAMGKPDFTGILDSGESAVYSEAFDNFLTAHGGEENISLGLLESPIMVKTLHAISHAPRYQNIEVSDYLNIVSVTDTEQISALTVPGPNGKLYVTFRGTDDTLTGWKENCELAVFDSVPAQRDAAKYLERMADKYAGEIIVSGHSKGGNLAIYASANAREDVRSRIERVISYDGPGFRSGFLESEGYLSIKDRVQTIVPRSSMVGMLMDHAGRLEVVECEKEGPSAHDIFIWNLEANGLLRAPELSDNSKLFHRAISRTLNEMDTEERQELVDEIFEVLSSTGADELMDFTENTAAQAVKLSQEFRSAKKIRQFILLLSRFCIKDVMSSSIEELRELKDRLI